MLKLNNVIMERIEQEKLAELRKQEAKRNQEIEFMEENEMSGRIASAIKEDKQISELQNEASKCYMKQFLQNQIQVNKKRASKNMEEKAEKERLERNRLVNLLSAEKQQSFYQQKEMLDKISDFRLSNKSFKKVKDKSESQDDYSFLDEDWQMEEIKTRVRDSESNRRKQLNIDSFNAVQHQIDNNSTNRKEKIQT